jgi:hypothetical protein
VAGRLEVVCSPDEDEPGCFDDEAKARMAANFDFIAAARAALPALLAEVRRLRVDSPIVVQ